MPLFDLSATRSVLLHTSNVCGPFSGAEIEVKGVAPSCAESTVPGTRPGAPSGKIPTQPWTVTTNPSPQGEALCLVKMEVMSNSETTV